ncbi:MAG: DinB family protein [Caldilineaceae bacterium]|nr:DinB family protein [Caldilineaceae bacterium]
MTTAVELFRTQYKNSLNWLVGTLDGTTSDVFTQIPGDRIPPISAQLVHIFTGADFFVLGQAAQQAPLITSSFADKSGIGELPPPGGDLVEWSRTAQIDRERVLAYGQAVYAAIDDYLASLTDDDLDQMRDLGSMGEQPVSWILNIILLNTFSHTGEISCIKGLNGLKGYPM